MNFSNARCGFLGFESGDEYEDWDDGIGFLVRYLRRKRWYYRTKIRGDVQGNPSGGKAAVKGQQYIVRRMIFVLVYRSKNYSRWKFSYGDPGGFFIKFRKNFW